MSDCRFDLNLGVLKAGPNDVVTVPVNGKNLRLVNGRRAHRGEIHVNELHEMTKSGEFTYRPDPSDRRLDGMDGYVMVSVRLENGRTIELPMHLESAANGKGRETFEETLAWVRREHGMWTDGDVERDLLEATVRRLPSRPARESARYAEQVTGALLENLRKEGAPRLTDLYLEDHPALVLAQTEALREMCMEHNGELATMLLNDIDMEFSSLPAPIYTAHLLASIADDTDPRFRFDDARRPAAVLEAVNADGIKERYPKLSDDEAESLASAGFTGVQAEQLRAEKVPAKELIKARDAISRLHKDDSDQEHAYYEATGSDPYFDAPPVDLIPVPYGDRAAAYVDARSNGYDHTGGVYAAALATDNAAAASRSLAVALETEGCDPEAVASALRSRPELRRQAGAAPPALPSDDEMRERRAAEFALPADEFEALMERAASAPSPTTVESAALEMLRTIAIPERVAIHPSVLGTRDTTWVQAAEGGSPAVVGFPRDGGEPVVKWGHVHTQDGKVYVLPTGFGNGDPGEELGKRVLRPEEARAQARAAAAARAEADTASYAMADAMWQRSTKSSYF